MPNYNIWVNQEEQWSNVQSLGHASSSYENMNHEDQFASVTEMVYDACMRTCDPGAFDDNVESGNFY